MPTDGTNDGIGDESATVPDRAVARQAPLRTDFAGGTDEPLDPLLVLGEQEAAPDAKGQIRSGRLAGKSLSAAIVILAVPVLLQQTLTAVVGLVDKIISGSLPESMVAPAMDAIGIGSFVGWFIAIAMSGLGIGGQAIVARAMGAGDLPLAERAQGRPSRSASSGASWSASRWRSAQRRSRGRAASRPMPPSTACSMRRSSPSRCRSAA